MTDHPMGMVAKVALTNREGRYAEMFSRGEWKNVAKFQDQQTGLWTSFQLCPASDLSFDEDQYLRNARASAMTKPRWRRIIDPRYPLTLARRATRGSTLGRNAFVLAMTEQEARGQGRIELRGDGRLELHWQISDHVIGAVNRSLHRFAGWLQADLHMAPGGLLSVLWSGAHHAGTCRLSALEESGVVDTSLKVHGTSRIYVCDASALPSTGASNPGMAIGALALRLSDHLRV